MNIQRFHAATSREALAKARAVFGEGTLILSNRPTPNGVEVVATAEDSLSSLDRPSVAPAPASAATIAMAQIPVEEDTEQLAMSTLSFQDYVRERMLRRRHESSPDLRDEIFPHKTSVPASVQAAPAPMAPPPQRAKPAVHAVPFAPSVARAKPAPAAATINSKGIVDELQAMKDMIEERFNTMAWLGKTKQDPIQSNLMLKLIRAGYSPDLARAVMERMPEEASPAEAIRWLMGVLEQNLRTDAGSKPIFEQGGVFALVGATGVGKTTTAAKLAAHCARVHGPNSVGLITLDTYRVAAHEQLRAFGRMLGVVAHLAHDRAALQDLLGLLGNKRMVLIDTTGIAPKDPRKRDMMDVLDLPGVNRLLVLNAGSHGDTMDEVLTSFKTRGVQQAILSKIDEAAKLGPALDAIIRHQLVLRGVCNGQRVPEDWEPADAKKLVRASMRSTTKSAFDPKAADLNFFFTPAPMDSSRQERAHA
ncbi:flagellar biosynthesis protein FlhF [Rhodoferax sp.]|uniref:flagellar biosynthesis protein FlhF n=1 Tax=Rhodoferax sp. TaxID=50421 RepID=UPI0025CF4461|nr:flagellar biosynthesis protein FlhF [Rhodoferax sp.]